MNPYIVAALVAASLFVVEVAFTGGFNLFGIAIWSFAAFCVAIAGRRAIVFAALGIFSVALLFDPAFAQQSAAPETVAQSVSETTKVTWAWGATLSSFSGALLNMALVGITAAFGLLARSIPSQIYAFLVTMRAEQLLGKAIAWGINSVANASKDKVLSVDVGNRVLREALQYVVDNAPGWLVTWLGGQEEIAKKIWARLDLAPDASAKDVASIATQVAPAKA